MKADDGNTEAEKVGTPHGVSNMVKLLITGSQAGSLIGISGQTIEKIRNSSGATVMILDKIQLPSCASAHDSDRLVQVSYYLDSGVEGYTPLAIILHRLQWLSPKHD